MARRSLLLFMTAARALAAHAQSSYFPPVAACKALLKPAVTPDVAAHASLDARRRNLLRYGALAAVAGAGMCCYYFASGVEAPLQLDDATDESESETCVKKGMTIRYGVLAAIAGAGMFCFFGSVVKPPVIKEAFASIGPRGPSRQEVLRLTALLQKVYKRLPKKEKTVEEINKDPIVTWFNRLKDVLTLPATLKDLYAVLVTIWFPFMKSSLDGTTYCICPFSGLITIVDIWEDGTGAKDGENVPPQKLEVMEEQVLTTAKFCSRVSIMMFDLTSLHNGYSRLQHSIPITLCGSKLVDLLDKMVTFPRKKSLQYYEISAEGSYNFEKPFLHLARKVSGDMNLKSVEETALVQQRNKSFQYYGTSPKSNYNFEKPFLHLARKVSGDMNLKFVQD